MSYARSDGAAAAELDTWLRGQGLHTFFDRSELRPGLRWVPALEEAIGRSDAVAILVGRHGIGNTQQYERELALVRQTSDDGFPVIPVLMPGCENPPTGFLQLLTWVDFSKGDSLSQQTEALEALRAAIHRQAVESSPVRAMICPYRGLEPFREEDAAFFCGRDDAIRDLVAQVQAYSFVAVVGPSGSGKSSLVFAGLLPALRQQRQTIMWDVVSIRPGAWPLHALATAFGTLPDNAGPATIDSYLENEAAAYRTGNTDMLARIVNKRLEAAPEKPDRLLIYVDQWEELYAMAPAQEDEAGHQQHSRDVERIISLLVAAASDPRSRATVVLTIRADFYNPLIRHALVSALLPRQQVNIPPMRSSDLRSAIEKPAKRAKLGFAPPELVDQILNDVGGEEGRLPLLQFALKETWERREGDRLTAEAYTEVGGVSGAIEKAAESAYLALTPAKQDAARRLFLRLVTPGEGQEDTRARSAIPDDPQQLDIIQLFSNSRTRLLVTGYETPQGGSTGTDVRATVEVAHEALIRRWPTLRAWVDENRDKLRTRAAILRAKTEWEAAAKDEGFLLPSGVQLERGRDLLGNCGDVPVDDIREYVEHSIERERRRLDAEREAELADQKRIADAERQAREAAEESARVSETARKAADDTRRQLRNRLVLTAVAGGIAVLASLGSVYQWKQTQTAKNNLASQNALLESTNARLERRLALRAAPLGNRPYDVPAGWFQVATSYASAVAFIEAETDAGEIMASGTIVNARRLNLAWDEQPVLVTATYVVSKTSRYTTSLRPEHTILVFFGPKGERQTVRLGEVLWQSEQLGVSVSSIVDKLPSGATMMERVTDKPIALRELARVASDEIKAMFDDRAILKNPGSQRPVIFVGNLMGRREVALSIGHLLGELPSSASAQPSNVEADLVYTYATLGGSGGSPIFDAETGDLIGIHLFGRRTEGIGEGISMPRILAAIRAGAQDQ